MTQFLSQGNGFYNRMTKTKFADK